MKRKTRAPGDTASRERRPVSATELLVTAALLSALIACTVPVAVEAREKLKSAECMGNLHYIGQAMRIYTQDNDDYLPAAYTMYGNGKDVFISWSRLLEPYLHAGVTDTYVAENNRTPIGDLKKLWANTGGRLWHCPADNIGLSISYGANPMVTGSSLMMYGTMRTPDWEPSKRFSEILHPERIVFAGDTNKLWSDDTQEYREVFTDWERDIDPPLKGKSRAEQRAWYDDFLKQDYTDEQGDCPSPGLYGCKGLSYRHSHNGHGTGYANVLFCDDHVKSVSPGDLKAENIFPDL
jgi:prepilin-type processing-associated H-X9-DG protein